MTGGPRTPGAERPIDANGVTLAVTEYPAAGRPPLVLLHGIGSRGVSWWPVIDDLAAHFHLYRRRPARPRRLRQTRVRLRPDRLRGRPDRRPRRSSASSARA